MDINTNNLIEELNNYDVDQIDTMSLVDVNKLQMAIRRVQARLGQMCRDRRYVVTTDGFEPTLVELYKKDGYWAKYHADLDCRHLNPFRTSIHHSNPASAKRLTLTGLTHIIEKEYYCRACSQKMLIKIGDDLCEQVIEKSENELKMIELFDKIRAGRIR